jgi:D-aminopeptidase
MSPLFQAVIETTEEAIYDSLCMARTMVGYKDRTIQALPLEIFQQSKLGKPNI